MGWKSLTEYGDEDLINVLNLGAGVQSSTVLLMSIEGELPKLDHCIFADTGWEPKAVYRQMDWLKGLAEAAGIKVHIVSSGNINEDAINAQVAGAKCGMTAEERQVAKDAGAGAAPGRWASMPYFTLSPEGDRGQIRRQCTYEYKIKAIEKCLRRTILGLKPRQRAPKGKQVRQWIGISSDEMQRMQKDFQKWSQNWYPLVAMGMSRSSCFAWMDSHGYPEPPRSACIGCPFHHNREWRRMKAEDPESWQEAIKFDATIRKMGGMRGDVFLHADRKPLEECNLWKDQQENQLPLFPMDDECLGMCGV